MAGGFGQAIVHAPAAKAGARKQAVSLIRVNQLQLDCTPKMRQEVKGRPTLLTRPIVRQRISRGLALISGPEARFLGPLSVKVDHLTLASKRRDSERGFTLILESEGGTAARQGRAFFARRQRTLNRVVGLP